jgi:excisionase family DNA binding protein
VSRDSPGDELLTLREARATYGIPRSTLYRRIRKGEVRAYRRGLGRETYVHRADLESLQRFHPKQRQPGSAKSIWDEMDEFRRRVFGDRVLTPSSAEIIEEERRKRDEEKGW